MNNIGELEPLRKEICSLKAKLKTRDERLERMETPHKKYEDMKHELRRSCKDPNIIDIAEYKNYVFELTRK